MGSCLGRISLRYMKENEMFVCERFQCRMRKWVCIERQVIGEGKRKKRNDFVWVKQFPECQGCEQGGEIRNETTENDE